MSDAQWAALEIPVSIAFFCRSTAAGKTVAFYPSPTGATESALPLTAWEALADLNPVLREMQLDVETLLIRKDRQATEVYLIPIDVCYSLVGRIRAHWRGISGGQEVRRQIDGFFTELSARAMPLEDAGAGS
jgi:hypothetical protein